MIGIVGGGIAGLAAAYRLQRTGHNVQIFEAQDRAGGLAVSYETDGDPIERYYHHLLKSETAIIDLLTELGLNDRVEWRVGRTGYYIDGTEESLNTPFEILQYPHLGFYDIVRLGLLTLGVEPQLSLPPITRFDDFKNYDDVPVKEFLKRKTTENVYENFWEPLLDAKFGHRKDEISAAWLLGRIQFRSERDLLRGEILGYLEGGFELLINTLQERVGESNIEFGTPVRELKTIDGRIDSLVTDDDEHNVDTVIIATMPNVLETLTGYASDIEFQGSICSVVCLRESLLENYWVNVGDEAPFGALIEHTNFVPTERYDGNHLLYIARYVQSPHEEIWQLEDETVEQRWLSAIESMYPSFDQSMIKWIRTSRNPRTAPVYECGYEQKIIPYDLGDAIADGVYYAGMATRAQYPDRSLSGGIEAGQKCADLINMDTDLLARRDMPKHEQYASGGSDE